MQKRRFPKSFGKFISNLRLENKLTVKELAVKSKISQPYLTQIGTGKRSMSNPDHFKHLAQALDIPIDTILIQAGYRLESEE